MTDAEYAEYKEYYRVTMRLMKRLNNVALCWTPLLLVLIYFNLRWAWGIGFTCQMACLVTHYLIGKKLDKRMDWVKAELIKDCSELERELLEKLPPMGSA